MSQGLPSVRPLQLDPDLQALRQAGRLDALIAQVQARQPEEPQEDWAGP